MKLYSICLCKNSKNWLNKWLLLPETRSFFAEKQNTPTPMTKSAEEFAAQIQRELPVWRKMVADAKI